MGNAFFVVQANALTGQDAELNRWYEEQHLDDCLACDTAVSAQRFRKWPESGPGAYVYLALYGVADPRRFAEDRCSKEGTPMLPRTPALALPAHAFFYRPAPQQPELLAQPERGSFYVEFLSAGSGDAAAERMFDRQKVLARVAGLGPSELLLVDSFQERLGWHADGIIFAQVTDEAACPWTTAAQMHSIAPLFVREAGLYHALSPRRTRS